MRKYVVILLVSLVAMLVSIVRFAETGSIFMLIACIVSILVGTFSLTVAVIIAIEDRIFDVTP